MILLGFVVLQHLNLYYASKFVKRHVWSEERRQDGVSLESESPLMSTVAFGPSVRSLPKAYVVGPK